MWFKRAAPKVKVSICEAALQSVFDECDRYDRDETGGRIVGVFERGKKGSLNIRIAGVIEPGPNAQRSSTSFFQDGEYQAQVFRRIEAEHPQIEHLGNWHTHHVNGHPTLSGGDIKTYHRIVNHEQHNLDFFYALLVVARDPSQTGLQRYQVRHYVLYRGDSRVYELDPSCIEMTQTPAVWPATVQSQVAAAPSVNNVRATDKDALEQLYPDLRPYQSKRANTLYWKGSMSLVDGSIVEVIIPEMIDDQPGAAPYYQVLLKNSPIECAELVEKLNASQFASATSAAHGLENTMNRALYNALVRPGR